MIRCEIFWNFFDNFFGPNFSLGLTKNTMQNVFLKICALFVRHNFKSPDPLRSTMKFKILI